MPADTQKPLHIPYDWLKTVSPDLLSNDDIPLFGSAPAFPWEQLKEFLQTKLHVKHFDVSRSNISQKTEDEMLTGIGAPFRIQAVTVAPIDQTLYFVMSEADISKLMSALLTTEETPLQLDPEFINPFFTFMAMEAVHAIGKVSFDTQLSFALQHAPETLPTTTAHCFDLTIELNQTRVMGRVIIPPEFRQGWKAHYVPKKLQIALNAQLAENIEMVIHLEAGRIQMPLKDWKSIKPGDFIGMDSCSLESSGRRGRLILTVDGNQLFRGKLKDGNIKILENPLYREDLTPMPNKKFDDDDEENVDFSENGTEFTEDESEFSGVEATENYDDEELMSEDQLSQIEQSEQELGEEEEAFDEHEEGEEEAEAETSSGTHKSKILPSSKPVAPHEIPLDIVVEVGRIRMSIQKIMELQPGNVLELDIRPENGVDLVVNGQKIAKAELLSLGENLGVRIIDIG